MPKISFKVKYYYSDNYHCERDDDVCSTADLPLVSGGGPLSDSTCSLPHLHGRDYSYVDLNALGEFADESSHVVCHTDLTTCCSGPGRHDRGLWFSPDGAELPSVVGSAASAADNPIVLRRQTQLVRLIRGTGPGGVPSGLYRCDIETVAVNDPGPDDGTPRETLYVGVYSTGGMYVQ